MGAIRGLGGVSRRAFVLAAAAALGLLGWFAIKKKAESIADAAPFVKPNEKWTAGHLFEFAQALPPSVMLTLKKEAGLLNQNDGEDRLRGREEDAREVQKQLLWLSSSVFTYPFRDEKQLDYHEVVRWVSKEAGIDSALVNSASSFVLERELFRVLFARLWDKLSEEDRKKLLEKLDSRGAAKDKSAIVALSGAGALAALNGAVGFMGFAFYVTMSTTIAKVAGAAGVTLPFATYAGASTLVGVLTGPVGWAVMSIAGLGGLVFLGRPNVQKTTRLITQLHALKIEALAAAGVPERDVFS